MNMKKIIAAIAALAIIAPTMSAQSASDLRSILSSLAGKQDSTSTTSTTSTSSDDSKGSTLGNLLGNLFGSSKLTVKSMEGTWAYSAPAVSFKSDNLLKKAGGAAAATAVEKKLAPYYKTAGFDRMQLTVAADSTFSMKVGSITLSGTIESAPEGSEANFLFNFKLGGSISLTKMDTYVSMSGTKSLSIMFDVSKLVTLIELAGKVSGNSTVKGVSSVLKSYDGICAGFKLSRSN